MNVKYLYKVHVKFYQVTSASAAAFVVFSSGLSNNMYTQYFSQPQLRMATFIQPGIFA